MADKPVSKTYIVGVTGFGLYVPSLDFNASQLVLEALPSVIDLPDGSGHVRIVKYPVIPVTYKGAASAVDDIWTTPYQRWATNLAELEANAPDQEVEFKQDLCLVIHMGQAPNTEEYALEKDVHGGGYTIKDVEGKLPNTLPGGDKEILHPNLNLEVIKEQVQKKNPASLIRVSTNAGRYLCEYILYCSLAKLARAGKKERRKALFMHVPAKNGKADIQKGKEICTALVAQALENAGVFK